MGESTNHDLIVLGGGPAGYSAAIYAARAALDVLVIEQGMPGGQIATTDEVENYPGIPGVTGGELGMKLQEHAERLGAATEFAMVTSLTKDADGLFHVGAGETDFVAPAVVVATGATPRQVGFAGEERFRGRGVSNCATCDGMFYRGKRVYVVGGGNAACEEGLFLTRFADEVIMVVRRDVFRAPQGVVDRLMSNDKVSVRFGTSIVSLEGEALPDKIVFRDNASEEITQESLEPGSFGVFVFAGTQPATELVRDLVDCGPDGGILTDESMATKTAGLFAAGDVRSKRLRQVITAASDGAIAATSAYQYLEQFR